MDALPRDCFAMLRVAWLAFLCLAVLITGRPAEAHAVLLEMMPADGAAVPQSPSEVMLHFNEPVTPVSVRVLDDHGRPVTGPADVVARDQEVRIALVKPLPHGTYLVSYRVVSLDGHPVGETLSFTIGDRPAPIPATALEGAADADTFWSVAAGADRALFLLALLAAAGGVMFYWLVGGDLGELTGSERGWLIASAAVGVVVAVVGIGVEGAYLLAAQPGLPPIEGWLLGAPTSLGNSLVIGAIALAILAVALLRRGEIAGFAGKAAAVVALLSPVMTGHAATAEPRWLTAPMLGLHALAAGLWAGSLVPLWVRLRRRPLVAMLPEVRAFSRLAVGVVGLLALAGFVLAAVQLRDPGALFNTAYGLRLAGKLGLVLLLLLAAAVNKLWLTPRLAVVPPARARLRASIGLEIALVAAILSITASLGQSVPPRAMLAGEHAHHMDMARGAMPGFSVLTYRDGNGALIEIAPARPGLNDVTVHLIDPSGSPLAPQEATLELSNGAAGIEPIHFDLTAAEPGLYRLRGVRIVAPGDWTVRLDALVTEFSKLTFQTRVPVR
jgi:copper transport protein